MTIKSYRSGVNVKAYGAKGDGTTDDTAAIQAALNTGSPIWIPAGSYQIASSLSLKADYQTIMGEGGQSKLRSSITNGDPIVKFDGYDHVQLHNLLITSHNNSTKNNAIGVGINASHYWHLERVYVRLQETAFHCESSLIGTMVNCWSKYCDVGLYGRTFNANNVDLNIENYEQAVDIRGSGNVLRLLCEGDACVTASKIDGFSSGSPAVGNHVTAVYNENNTTGSVSDWIIGGTYPVRGLRMMIAGAHTATTAAYIQLDNVDGVILEGTIEKGTYPEWVSTTSNTRNVQMRLSSGTRSTGGYVAPLPCASAASFQPMNHVPDPFYWKAIPTVDGHNNATSAEETSTVPPFTKKSLKVTGTVGTSYNYAYKTYSFTTYSHLAAFKGKTVGIAWWVFVPNVSFYTMNSPGAGIECNCDGTGTPSSGTNNINWCKGKWAFCVDEIAVPADATYINVRWRSNWSATNATADTYAYFVGPLLWIGGYTNAYQVCNGQLSHHAAVWLEPNAQTYTETGDSTDRAFNASTVAVGELANVVATLIKDLRTQGIVK